MVPRFAKRVDDNQRQIVRELRQIPGVSCAIIGEPVDLLVGFRSRNFLFEIKRADKVKRPSALTAQQRTFIPNWTGQVRIVSTTDEILQTITQSYAHENAEPRETPSAPDP